MTRYFYFPHSNKEIPVTKSFNLAQVVWIYSPAGPLAITFRSSKDSWLLFETKEACAAYYA